MSAPAGSGQFNCCNKVLFLQFAYLAAAGELESSLLACKRAGTQARQIGSNVGASQAGSLG